MEKVYWECFTCKIIVNSDLDEKQECIFCGKPRDASVELTEEGKIKYSKVFWCDHEDCLTSTRCFDSQKELDLHYNLCH